MLQLKELQNYFRRREYLIKILGRGSEIGELRETYESYTFSECSGEPERIQDVQG